MLLYSYLHWVHPLVPLVELPYILHRLLHDDDRDFPHTFLYQAILYAGSSFLDPVQLQEAGLPNRQHIGAVLRERARLLYNTATERNPIIQAQGLILLSIRENLSEAALSESWLWVGQALSAAIKAALLPAADNNYIQEKDYLCTISSSLLTCLVWSLYIADLTISMALDTPLQIPQLPPKESRFISAVFTAIEAHQAVPEEARFFPRPYISRQLPAPEHCDQLAEIMTQRSKLVRLVYQILAPANSKLKTEVALGSPTIHILRNGFKAPILLSRISQLDFYLLDLAESQLRDWLDNLPPSARYGPVSLLTVTRNSGTKTEKQQCPGPRRLSIEFVVGVHQAALYILCLALMLSLYISKVHVSRVGSSTSAVKGDICSRIRIQRWQLASELVQTWSTLAAAQAIPFLPSYCFFSLRLAREVFHEAQVKPGADVDGQYARWAVRSCDRFLAVGFG